MAVLVSGEAEGTKGHGYDGPVWRKGVVFLPRPAPMPTIGQLGGRTAVQPARSLHPASVYAADYKTKLGPPRSPGFSQSGHHPAHPRHCQRRGACRRDRGGATARVVGAKGAREHFGTRAAVDASARAPLRAVATAPPAAEFAGGVGRWGDHPLLACW